MDETQATIRVFPPRWLRIMGWIALPGTLAFAVDLIWEQTLLTWQRGPQMVGFALTHAHTGLFIFMVLSALTAHLFLFCVLSLAIRDAIRRTPFRAPQWLEIMLLLCCVAVLYIPYGVWRFVVVETAGPGGHGGEHMSFAAAFGEGYVVRALLAKGVTVDAPGSSGSTALNAACVEKKVQMARYLLSRGADLERAPDCQFVEEVVPHPNRVRVPGATIEVH